MTEYWVSQAKYHCKVCNCYIADNRASRLHHETSMGHKIKTEQYMKQKKNEKLQGLRNEQELKKTLEQIERAARVAMTQSKDGGEILYKTGQLSAPPPPQFRQNFNDRATNSTMDQIQQNNSTLSAVSGALEEDSPGFYTVRGVTYLEGAKFEDKLVNGVNCEVFIEELDEWLPVEQLNRKEVHIPNTSVKFVRFHVKYFIKNEDGTSSQHQVEDIKSDQLRIIATAKEVEELMMRNSDEADDQQVSTNKSTAEMSVVGGWQTVSIRTVDEEKEREESERAVEAMRRGEYDEEEADANIGPKSIQTARQFIYSSEPILYKGVLVQDEEMPSTALSNIDRDDSGEPVQFVKRRKLNMNLRTAGTSKAPASATPTTVVVVPTITAIDSIESKEDDAMVSTKIEQNDRSDIITKSNESSIESHDVNDQNKISFKLIKPVKNFRKR